MTTGIKYIMIQAVSNATNVGQENIRHKQIIVLQSPLSRENLLVKNVEKCLFEKEYTSIDFFNLNKTDMYIIRLSNKFIVSLGYRRMRNTSRKFLFSIIESIISKSSDNLVIICCSKYFNYKNLFTNLNEILENLQLIPENTEGDISINNMNRHTIICRQFNLTSDILFSSRKFMSCEYIINRSVSLKNQNNLLNSNINPEVTEDIIQKLLEVNKTCLLSYKYNNTQNIRMSIHTMYKSEKKIVIIRIPKSQNLIMKIAFQLLTEYRNNNFKILFLVYGSGGSNQNILLTSLYMYGLIFYDIPRDGIVRIDRLPEHSFIIYDEEIQLLYIDEIIMNTKNRVTNDKANLRTVSINDVEFNISIRNTRADKNSNSHFM